MRQLEVAEFVYILNGYNDYVWNFEFYLLEHKKRSEINKLWQVYMASVCRAGIKDFPNYYELVQNIENKTKKQKETPQQATQRLIEKINKYNLGV